jgi:hypothetical protein
MRYILLLLFSCGDKQTQEDSIFPASSHIDVSTLSNSNCQDVEGTPVAGAEVYFAGNFGIDGDVIKGVEVVYFMANETWKATGEDDCQIVLQVTGNFTDIGTCTACDTGISLVATIIDSQSTCPQGLQTDYESLIETYAIQQLPDGSANWFFHSSGNQFASGSHTDESLQYLSDFQCQWY